MRMSYTVLAILIAASVSFSCAKTHIPVDNPDNEENENVQDSLNQDPPQIHEPVGTYIYDGEEYPVFSISYAADESSVMIKISPQEEAEKTTTYAIIGINSAYMGRKIDVEYAWNNDDYYFVYETPLKYYSHYRKLISGSIFMERSAAEDDVFHIEADLILPDETDFFFEYEGKISDDLKER